MRIIRTTFLILIVLTTFAAISSAQGKGKTNKRPAGKAATTATPAPTPQPTPEPSTKRNERPNIDSASPVKAPVSQADGTRYCYIFTRPGFTYSRVVIEHDESGKGQISFQRESSDEPIVDPVELSAATMKNLSEAVAALNFLDSTEEYQVARDYSHMGNVEFMVKKSGRERTVRYNWTENKHAKALMDEYRRISNEYLWRFEIILARQNQPLLTPGLMESIDSYIDRKEISDPPSLVPFLTELSTDERLPLMARNRATKIIKAIEKAKK